MAIGMRQELPDLTDEQAAVIAALVNAPRQKCPGFIAHASGPIAGGYQVTELWESREAFERFSDAVILPLLQQVGVTGPVSPRHCREITNLVTREA